MPRSRGKVQKGRARRGHGPSRFALCVDNSDYPVSLQQWKIYRVLHDSDAARHRQVRVIDESGEDYLFSAASFQIVDLPAKVRRLYREKVGA
jgi:hypothetical protein